ncbi:hypothetical protein OKA05_03210 [Luteolibacter arcticus]|uniref:Uncharacterized protein n=1 Tax=Luteolibacter arcticus TaxID=1581411 RepID=A0ABT3GDM8_9BACT|nr:hypothetical protein [Luteolibacter arcticus]MCW1921546.1 hypothetical protein [Luteolibacter arcticus]
MTFLLSPCLAQAEAKKLTPAVEMELDYVRSLAEDLRTKAKAPLTELEDKYRGAVEKIRDEAKAANNAANLLEAEAALEELAKSGTPDGESAHAGIARLEKIYLEQRPKVAEQIRPALVKAEQSFGQDLQRMVEEQTKKGEIEQAILLKKEMDGVAGRLKSMQQAFGLAAGRSRPPSKVTILKATFASGDQSADVTRKIAELVANGRDFSASPKDMGVDPKPYHRKHLKISYEKDGIKREQHRGENETVLAVSFTGPQDGKELAAWLTGSTWKSETRELFFKSASDVKVKDVTGKWQPDGIYFFNVEWSAGNKKRYQFNWHWTELREHGGEKFVPVN